MPVCALMGWVQANNLPFITPPDAQLSTHHRNAALDAALTTFAGAHVSNEALEAALNDVANAARSGNQGHAISVPVPQPPFTASSSASNTSYSTPTATPTNGMPSCSCCIALVGHIHVMMG